MFILWLAVAFFAGIILGTITMSSFLMGGEAQRVHAHVQSVMRETSEWMLDMAYEEGETKARTAIEHFYNQTHKEDL